MLTKQAQCAGPGIAALGDCFCWVRSYERGARSGWREVWAAGREKVDFENLETPSEGLGSVSLGCLHPAPSPHRAEHGPLVCREGTGQQEQGNVWASPFAHPSFWLWNVLWPFQQFPAFWTRNATAPLTHTHTHTHTLFPVGVGKSLKGHFCLSQWLLSRKAWGRGMRSVLRCVGQTSVELSKHPWTPLTKKRRPPEGLRLEHTWHLPLPAHPHWRLLAARTSFLQDRR